MSFLFGAALTDRAERGHFGRPAPIARHFDLTENAVTEAIDVPALLCFYVGGPLFVVGFFLSLRRSIADTSRSFWALMSLSGALMALPVLLEGFRMMLGLDASIELVGMLLGGARSYFLSAGTLLALGLIVHRVLRPVATPEAK